jgi:hypothetical protein
MIYFYFLILTYIFIYNLLIYLFKKSQEKYKIMKIKIFLNLFIDPA